MCAGSVKLIQSMTPGRHRKQLLAQLTPRDDELAGWTAAELKCLVFVGSDRSPHGKLWMFTCRRGARLQILRPCDRCIILGKHTSSVIPGCNLQSWWVNVPTSWSQFIMDYEPAVVHGRGRCPCACLWCILTWADPSWPYGDVYRHHDPVIILNV